MLSDRYVFRWMPNPSMKFTFLKHRGFFDFPTTQGLYFPLPSALQVNPIVILSFPAFDCSVARVRFGVNCQFNSVSSKFRMFLRSYLLALLRTTCICLMFSGLSTWAVPHTLWYDSFFWILQAIRMSILAPPGLFFEAEQPKYHGPSLWAHVRWLCLSFFVSVAAIRTEHLRHQDDRLQTVADYGELRLCGYRHRGGDIWGRVFLKFSLVPSACQSLVQIILPFAAAYLDERLLAVGSPVALHC